MMTRYLPHCVLVVLGVDDYNSLLTAESMLDYIKNTWLVYFTYNKDFKVVPIAFI